MDENKENIKDLRNKIGKLPLIFVDPSGLANSEFEEECNILNSQRKRASDKSVSDNCVYQNFNKKFHPLKKFIENSKICMGGINKLGKKSLKRIKQSNIKKSTKDVSQVNFGTKITSSTRNTGTSRVSYNKIF